MESIDKGLNLIKRGLIIWLEIPQMPPKFSAQLVYPSPKVWDFRKKIFLWVSVVRGHSSGMRRLIQQPNIASQGSQNSQQK